MFLFLTILSIMNCSQEDLNVQTNDLSPIGMGAIPAIPFVPLRFWYLKRVRDPKIHL